MTGADRPAHAAAGSDPIDGIAARVRAALAGSVPDDPGRSGPFRGAAAEGLVAAEVEADGSLRTVTLAPEVFDRPVADVAAAARVAINAALDARPGRVDVGPIVAQVRTTQEEARRGLGTVTQALTDVESRVRAARGGDPAWG